MSDAKWISVKDQLPERGVRVLVKCEGSDEVKLGVCPPHPNPDVCYWYVNNEIRKYKESGQVTHWFPVDIPDEA